MPRLPRITGAEVLAKLRRDGWAVARIQGSHHLLEHPTRPGRLVVPVHAGRIVVPGILGRIIGDAGLTVEQFIDL